MLNFEKELEYNEDRRSEAHERYCQKEPQRIEKKKTGRFFLNKTRKKI